MRLLSRPQRMLANTATFAENAAAMAKALELLKACETDLRQIAIDEAVKNGKGDLTSLIENADFSKGSAGWTTWPTFTQANGQVARILEHQFLYGTVSGRPAEQESMN